MAMPTAIEAERLSLRLLSPADVDIVHALFSSSGHTIGDGPVNDMAATLAWLERRSSLHEQTGLAWYGLWDRRDATFVGTCGVFLGRCGDQPEIGYEITENRRGHGYAAEAANLVTRACHAAGHEHIWATIRPANIASIRTVQTIGYVLVRTAPDVKGPLDYYRHTAGEAP